MRSRKHPYFIPVRTPSQGVVKGKKLALINNHFPPILCHLSTFHNKPCLFLASGICYLHLFCIPFKTHTFPHHHPLFLNPVRDGCTRLGHFQGSANPCHCSWFMVACNPVSLWRLPPLQKLAHSHKERGKNIRVECISAQGENGFGAGLLPCAAQPD